MKSAYLIIAHGSRDPDAAKAFEAFIDRFKRVFRRGIIHGAYLEFMQPNVREGIERCLQEGAGQVYVLPLMFFPGRHLNQDIPEIISEAKARYPQVDFHFSGPLADHPDMLELLKQTASQLENSNKGSR